MAPPFVPAAGPYPAAAPARHELHSPDGLTAVVVELADAVRWSVARRGVSVLERSPIGMTLEDGTGLGRAPNARRVARSTVDLRLAVPVPTKRRTVLDRCHQLAIDLRDGLGLVFRAYDDGVAYRLTTAFDRAIRVRSEEAVFRFPRGAMGWLPIADCSRKKDEGVDCFHTSFEEVYSVFPLRELGEGRQAFLPVLVEVPGGPKVVLTEADLDDYPGMWVTGATDGTPTLRAIFPPWPLEERIAGQAFPQAVVSRRAGYIAATTGRRGYPWRVLAIADRDAQLAETDIVWRLGGETAVGDWSWICPGKSQSEWLWDNILYAVDFRAGYNTETYRHYLAFAERFRTGYLFFDAGWSKVTDVFDLTPTIDVPGLVREARTKGIGVVLWTSALAMSRQMTAALDRFREWGVSGIVVDFMDRDDQPMVRFYRRVAEEAAKRRLFVDFHGAFKPTGLERRLPNAITREGLVAFEWSKWSDVLTPDYETALPFIRQVAGPMDYEPGQMRNAQRESFRVMGAQPMSQGTRVHQLAMFVVYESPYAKMGGNVSDYEREPEFTAFMASIPTSWEKTRVLDGAVGDFIVTLRTAANGDVWVGAMTDWTPRELPLDLAFLGEGRFEADIYEDGENADRYGADWQHLVRRVTAADRLGIRMAPGGGWVARFGRRPLLPPSVVSPSASPPTGSNDPWPPATPPGHTTPRRQHKGGMHHGPAPIPPGVPRRRSRLARRRRGRDRPAEARAPGRRPRPGGGPTGAAQAHARKDGPRGHGGRLRLHDHLRPERHRARGRPGDQPLRHRAGLPARQQRAAGGRGPQGPARQGGHLHQERRGHEGGCPRPARREPQAAGDRPRRHLVPARKGLRL
jgi:alpha-glucosidase